MTEQAAVVGTCAVCDQIILTPAPGVVVSQLGDGDQQEDGTFIYYHFRCINPHEASNAMFRSYVLALFDMLGQRLANHEATHARPTPAPAPRLYVPE